MAVRASCERQEGPGPDRRRLRRASRGGHGRLPRREALKLLLDTHALLWWLDGSAALSSAAGAAIGAERNRVVAGAATAWEIAIKRSAGTLKAPSDLAAALEEARIEQLAVTFEHALRAGALPPHHGDPFDRVLVAQAQLEDMTIVTRDRALAAYEVELLGA